MLFSTRALLVNLLKAFHITAKVYFIWYILFKSTGASTCPSLGCGVLNVTAKATEKTGFNGVKLTGHHCRRLHRFDIYLAAGTHREEMDKNRGTLWRKHPVNTHSCRHILRTAKNTALPEKKKRLKSFTCLHLSQCSYVACGIFAMRDT